MGKIRVDLPVEVAAWLLNNKREELLYGERRYGVRIEIVADEKLLRHETRFTTSPREKTDEVPAPAPAAEQAHRTEPAAEASTPAQAASRPDPATPAKPTEPTEPDAKAGETTAGEAKGGEPGDEGAAAPNGRPKRRRKRRRKPRSAAPAAPDVPNAPAESNASTGAPSQEKHEKKTNPDDVPLAVPRGVRADELMPAASGSADRGGKPKKKNGAPRPRKSGSRPRSRRGGSRRGGDGAAKDGPATRNGGS